MCVFAYIIARVCMCVFAFIFVHVCFCFYFCSSVCMCLFAYLFLPACANEQGNVIGSVRIYIYICVYQKKLIERTRDLIYLKFVATDFFPKIISLTAGENSGDLA